jgi:hypothetical protein
MPFEMIFGSRKLGVVLEGLLGLLLTSRKFWHPGSSPRAPVRASRERYFFIERIG